MKRSSLTWLGAVAPLLLVVGVGLSPPVNADVRSQGVNVTLKGNWIRSTYEAFGTRTISGGSECTPELPKTGLTAAWASITSNAFSVSGGGGALACNPNCPPVTARVEFTKAPVNRATYIRTNGLRGWVEVEATCTADYNACLVGADSRAAATASVRFESTLTAAITAAQTLAVNSATDPLMVYDPPDQSYHTHGCGETSWFQWVSGANAMIDVGANYGIDAKSDGNCFVQLWNCAVNAAIVLRD